MTSDSLDESGFRLFFESIKSLRFFTFSSLSLYILIDVVWTISYAVCVYFSIVNFTSVVFSASAFHCRYLSADYWYLFNVFVALLLQKLSIFLISVNVSLVSHSNLTMLIICLLHLLDAAQRQGCGANRLLNSKIKWTNEPKKRNTKQKWITKCSRSMSYAFSPISALSLSYLVFNRWTPVNF